MNFCFFQALESSYFTSNPPPSKPEDIPRFAAPRHRHSRDPFHMNDVSSNDENVPSDYSHLNSNYANSRKIYLNLFFQLKPNDNSSHHDRSLSDVIPLFFYTILLSFSLYSF